MPWMVQNQVNISILHINRTGLAEMVWKYYKSHLYIVYNMSIGHLVRSGSKVSADMVLSQFHRNVSTEFNDKLQKHKHLFTNQIPLVTVYSEEGIVIIIICIYFQFYILLPRLVTNEIHAFRQDRDETHRL